MIKILIIEDNRSIRENTAELLDLEGYKTFTAPNGVVGLKQAQLHKPDLILCDLRMPEMDGFSFFKRLRRRSSLKKIPVIFFSAKSELAEIKMGVEVGANVYVVKPYELEDLLSSINKCLKTK